jgi:hypothetical protein
MLDDLKKKAIRLYDSKEIFRSYLLGENKFPLEISLRNVSSAKLRDEFVEVGQQIDELATECKKFYLEILFNEVSNRQRGLQNIPDKVIFPNLESYLHFISKAKEYQLFKYSIDEILRDESPKLRDFLAKSPQVVIEYSSDWPKILAVSKFLINNPKTNLYIRQLEIPDVDTKFIQNYKRIILQIVTVLSDSTDANLESLEFEERLGLRKESGRVRFRILDRKLQELFYGLEDIETSIEKLAEKEIPCENIIIVENKITGLCLPNYDKTIVFFELGYKAALLKQIPWISNKRIVYWGDIDTYGFSILSNIREAFPDAETRLMDLETLFAYQNLWVQEDVQYKGACERLTPAELDLFNDLRNNRYGQGVRLEQERIKISDFKL